MSSEDLNTEEALKSSVDLQSMIAAQSAYLTCLALGYNFLMDNGCTLALVHDSVQVTYPPDADIEVLRKGFEEFFTGATAPLTLKPVTEEGITE